MSEIERPVQVPGVTEVKKVGCGKVYITDSIMPEFPEVFIRLGKPGTCTDCWCQALGRVISFALRFQEETAEERRQKIVRAIKGIQCPNPMFQDGVQNLSCPDAIAKVLERKTKVNKINEPDNVSNFDTMKSEGENQNEQ